MVYSWENIWEEGNGDKVCKLVNVGYKVIVIKYKSWFMLVIRYWDIVYKLVKVGYKVMVNIVYKLVNVGYKVMEMKFINWLMFGIR